jgi:hypothetical protein
MTSTPQVRLLPLLLLAPLVVACLADGDEDAEGQEAAATASSVCTATSPACPADEAEEGRGYREIDRCAFPLAGNGFQDSTKLIAALERISKHGTVNDIVGDLNREASKTKNLPGVTNAFSWLFGLPKEVEFALNWSDADVDALTWIPQGMTGSLDAAENGRFDGKRMAAVSWYYRPEKEERNRGVRISFLDLDTLRYRHALLAVPTGTVDNPSYQPLELHAGGIVWYGTKLYVADTSRGFRVFDLAHVLEPNEMTDPEAVGCAGGNCSAFTYKYVIPQIGAYATRSTCAPKFSFVSLDRSGAEPALISGEYCDGGDYCKGRSATSGRLFRWPIDPASGLLRGATAWPSQAVSMGQRQVQGAAADGDDFYLTSSATGNGGGVLYHLTKDRVESSRWADGPEDLMIDRKAKILYSVSEAKPRVVFAMHMP